MYKALCREGIVFTPQSQEEHAFLFENKITFPIENTNVITFCVWLVVLASRKRDEERGREGEERRKMKGGEERREEAGRIMY